MYNPDLTADKDKVRHKIGDVYDDVEFLTDAEIRFALEENNDNVTLAASDCCFAIAARVARNTDYRFSTLWQDASQAYKHFNDMGERFALEAAEESSLSPQFTGDDETPNIFAIGMFDYDYVDDDEC